MQQTLKMSSVSFNEFHQKWNEACMQENERVRSTRYSVEYLKAQSQRLKEQIKAAGNK